MFLFFIRAVTACVIEHKVAAQDNPVVESEKSQKRGKNEGVEGALRMLVKKEGRQVCV